MAVASEQEAYMADARAVKAEASELRLAGNGAVRRFYGPGVRRVFMGIYNNLQLAGDCEQRNFLICAATRGEGGTTVAIGLALAAAEVQDRPVLLIDGNFSDPQVAAAFGLPERYGFGDLLAGRLEAHSAVWDSGWQQLKVMSAGVAPLNHVSLLESPVFKNLLACLNREYATIIIDGPAVNSAPESVLYGAMVDRTFLVVHAGATRVQVVDTALEKLETDRARPVDLILNRRTFPIPPWIYRRL